MTALAVFIIAIIILVIIRAIFTAETRNPTNKGKAGEDRVSLVLRSLPQEYLVIDNVIIPDQGSGPSNKYTTQIDHVVVSPFGIFVIETKNYSGWIFGSEKRKRWKQTFKTIRGHYFYNPIKQNWGHTFALVERLHLNTRVFKPIVVFSDDCELNVESKTPVIHIYQLKQLILNYTQKIIPQEEVALIYDKLSKINLVGDEYETTHVESIEERFIEKETTLQKGRCPRCGGELKLRNGKYGPFYGCSNYPNCRFTHKVG